MAKPDLDDGWLPYAHELDAALAVAGFGKGERVVLREVFVQIFGLAQSRTASLSPVDVAGRTGISKEHVVRVIGSLVDCRVLQRVARGQYRFVKDYEKWTSPDGSPRLSPVEIAWCRSSPHIARSFQVITKAAQKMGAPCAPFAPPKGAPCAPNDPDERSAVRSQMGAHGAPMLNNPPTPPHRNGRANSEIGDVDDDPSSSADGDTGSGGAPPVAGVTVKMLVDEARRLFNEGVAKEILYHSADILGTFGDRLDCYLAAMREAARTKTPIGRPHRYFKRVGEGYLANGVPPEPASIEPKAVPLKPAERAAPPPPPEKAASAGCERCHGQGIASVWRKLGAPERLPESAVADCVCPLGRHNRGRRDEAGRRAFVDLEAVLAGRSANWQADPAEAES